MTVLTLTVTTKPRRLLVNNPKRKFWAVINAGTVDVYVGHDSNVSTSGKTKGIPVKANGGMYGDEYYQGEVWAVADSETEVTIVEVSEE